MIASAQKTRLEALRVPVNAMIHPKIEVKPDITLTGAAGLTVGDWVEVEHDFTPGINSGGGVGIITSIVEIFSNVKYILDGHAHGKTCTSPATDMHPHAISA